MEDSRIIELFEARSERAIAGLSEKYGGACRAIAKNILNNELDAEECVNDAYLGVWNTVPPQKPDPLQSYVFRIVRNLAIKRYHSNTAVKRNSYYDAALDELSDCIAAPDSVDSCIFEKELAATINRFLSTLDQEDRVMFVRRYWYADPVADIAAKIHKSANSVSVRLFRLREKLRAYLRKEGITV